MHAHLEVLVLPVSDVDAAKEVDVGCRGFSVEKDMMRTQSFAWRV